MRELLETLEAADGDPSGALAWLAGRNVGIDEAELRGAVRRAMLLLATGGDPRRDLFLDDRAVESLADDLDTAPRREALEEGLAGLAATGSGLPRVGAALAELRAEPELAWRWYALSLVASELGDDDDL
jgi:hypothetical protein